VSEEALRARIERMQARIDQLELMIEDRALEIFVANEKYRVVSDFLHEIYKAMPGALLVFDREGIIEAANDAAHQLLEYEGQELIGRHVDEIFEMQDVPNIAEIERHSLRRAVLRMEKACITKTGMAVPVLFSATALGPAEGQSKARGAVCVALDIRDRKKLEMEYRHAQKLESVGRLASGIAHEINTPVQFVNDSVTFIRDAMGDLTQLFKIYRQVRESLEGGLPLEQALNQVRRAETDADLDYILAQVPKALDRSIDGLGRVASIVRSMKEFAHPDQKEMSAVDLNQSILSTLTIARNEYKYVADVETHLGDLPRVICHGGDLNQAVLNVVVNAAHAIAERVKGTETRGRIWVSTYQQEQDVVIAIRDTGGGIPQDVRERMFDPFFTTKEVGCGTGQGLPIARSVVVDRHGGELTFDSVMGQGTTFYIRIPIAGKFTPGAEMVA
jgi:PAS domain S-box-containing protein